MDQNRLKRVFDVTVSSVFAGIAIICFLLYFGTFFTVGGGVDIDFNFFTKYFPDEVKLLTEVSEPSDALIDAVTDDGILVLLYAGCALATLICLIICLCKLPNIINGKKEFETKTFGYAIATPLIFTVIGAGYKFECGISLGWAGVLIIILNAIALGLFWARRIALADTEKVSRLSLGLRAIAVGILFFGGIIGAFVQISHSGYECSGGRYMMDGFNVIIYGGKPSDYMKFAMGQIGGLLLFVSIAMVMGNATLEFTPTKKARVTAMKQCVMGLILLIAGSILICIESEDYVIGVGTIFMLIASIAGLVLEIVGKNINKKYLAQKEAVVPEVVEPTVD